MIWLLAVAIAQLAASPPTGPADREWFVLKDGHQIYGELVAEKLAYYVVDVGYDVLKVPRDQVERRRPGPDGPTATGAGPTSPPPADRFYQVGPLPKGRAVNELVEEYGSGVLLIETPSSQGSGFLVNSDGYIVTNNHVIEGETRLSAIAFENGPAGLVRHRIDAVEIVALNPFVDLALLKAPLPDGLKLKPLVLGNLDNLAVGDGVFAVGNPLNLDRTVSQGILSTLNRNFQGLVYLQTDAAINPGNSGGPLLNLRGEVVGVVNMKASQGDNLGFAIPIPYVKDFLRNRSAFAFDKSNPNTGYRYLDAPRRPRAAPEAVAAPTVGAVEGRTGP